MKIKDKRILIPLILLLAAVLGIATVTAAKYAADYNSGKNPVTPEGFYFDTDLVEGNSYIAVEGTDFTFKVRNHDMLGGVTADGIAFTVTAGAYTLPAVYTLDGGSESELEVSLPLSEVGCAAGDTLAVTVATKDGASPFNATLSFNLTVVRSSEASYYSVIDRGAYVELILNIGSTAPGSVIISYGSLAPDNTNPLMQSWRTADGQGTLTSGLEAHSSYTLRFFGADDVPTVSGALLPPNNAINLTGGGV